MKKKNVRKIYLRIEKLVILIGILWILKKSFIRQTKISGEVLEDLETIKYEQYCGKIRGYDLKNLILLLNENISGGALVPRISGEVILGDLENGYKVVAKDQSTYIVQMIKTNGKLSDIIVYDKNAPISEEEYEIDYEDNGFYVDYFNGFKTVCLLVVISILLKKVRKRREHNKKKIFQSDDF